MARLYRGQYWEAGPPLPTQEDPFPQSSCPPRGESKAITGLQPAILVPSPIKTKENQEKQAQELQEHLQDLQGHLQDLQEHLQDLFEGGFDGF